jgi:hypothetical protein
MLKSDVLDIIDDLESDVQEMRENGETDLRSVLHMIDVATRKIKALEEK